MSGLLRALVGYQAWANDDLFSKLEALDADSLEPERQAILRLMDHSYVVAQIFAAHLTGGKHFYTSDNTPDIPSLAELRAAVAASDRWYLDYVRTVSPPQLAERIAFNFTDGDRGYMSREEMLTHVVLHGGYHRGEAGRILAQASIKPPWDTFAVYVHQSEPARRLQRTAVA